MLLLKYHTTLTSTLRKLTTNPVEQWVLPNGTGETQRVLVFARGAKAEEAKAAGADFVGEDELVAKINSG